MASASLVPSSGAAFQKLHQRLFGFVQPVTTKRDQVVKIFESSIKHLALFESIYYFRTNIRSATNCRSISQNLGGLFDRRHDSFVSRNLLHRNLAAITRQRAGAN